jgi:hypothetical protein
MRVSAELSGSDSGITFTGLSSRACNKIRVRSFPFHFVESEADLCQKECALSIALLETANDFSRWHAFICEESGNMALFKSQSFNAFCPNARTFAFCFCHQHVSTRSSGHWEMTHIDIFSPCFVEETADLNGESGLISNLL